MYVQCPHLHEIERVQIGDEVGFDSKTSQQSIPK